MDGPQDRLIFTILEVGGANDDASKEIGYVARGDRSKTRETR